MTDTPNELLAGIIEGEIYSIPHDPNLAQDNQYVVSEMAGGTAWVFWKGNPYLIKIESIRDETTLEINALRRNAERIERKLDAISQSLPGWPGMATT